MTVEMVLNELSFADLAPSVSIAQQWMLGLVDTMAAAVERGVTSTLRAELDFADHLRLAPSYTLGSWYNDRRVDEVARTYLLTFSTQKPFLADLRDVAQKSTDQICSYAGRPAIGLGVAYLLDGLSVSALSTAGWDTSYLPASIYWIDDEGEHSDDIRLRHASRIDHVDENSAWIEQRLKLSVKTGAELWAHSAEFFPNLELCEAVEAQMRALPKDSVTSIRRGLFCLQRFCLAWIEGPFHKILLECVASEESPSTLNEYSAERTFRCPDGQKRVFNWHVKPGTSWRVHFDPFYYSGAGCLLVGYVGKHLRTAKIH